MNCKDMKEVFANYLDGQVSPEEKEKIQAHLSACRHCQMELESIAAIQGNLRHAFKITAAGTIPSLQSLARIWERIEAEDKSRDAVSVRAKSRIGVVKDILVRRLVSPQPAWKVVVVGLLVVALIASLIVVIPGMRQSPEALAASIAQNSPQVRAALGGGGVQVVKAIINTVDEKGTVIVKGELGLLTIRVDLRTKTVVEVIPEPQLTEADKDRALEIATADPRVKRFLVEGATISKVETAHLSEARTNLETGKTEISFRAVPVVVIETEQGMTWGAEVDLDAGVVVRELTPMGFQSPQSFREVR